METKKAVLRQGFDNRFKVKATPWQSMKWIEKPKELTPEKITKPEAPHG